MKHHHLSRQTFSQSWVTIFLLFFLPLLCCTVRCLFVSPFFRPLWFAKMGERKWQKQKYGTSKNPNQILVRSKRGRRGHVHWKRAFRRGCVSHGYAWGVPHPGIATFFIVRRLKRILHPPRDSGLGKKAPAKEARAVSHMSCLAFICGQMNNDALFCQNRATNYGLVWKREVSFTLGKRWVCRALVQISRDPVHTDLFCNFLHCWFRTPDSLEQHA